MTTGTKANHKLLPQPVDSPNFLPLLRLLAVVDSPDAHWRQLFLDSRFQCEKKISERITDGKTLLTMCVKLSLCEIAAKSHLVFTRHTAFSLFRTYKPQCMISQLFCKDILGVPFQFLSSRY